LLDLVSPWFNTERVVCADSYFSSVQTAVKLKEHRMKYIGVVKTATKQFPMQYLGCIELPNKGGHVGLISKDDYGEPDLLSFVWRDRDRRYFIASGSSLAAGQPVSRDWYRQLVKDYYTPPEKVNITIPQPQPQASELNYDCLRKN
jgi:Transposase IS4